MKNYPTREQVEKIKEQYPVGSLVKLISMRDPYHPVPSGTVGKIMAVDDIGSLIVKWNNGQGLNLLPYEDRFEVLLKPEELLTEKHTVSDSRSENYLNKVVVIKAESLLDFHRTAKNQLWIATHGAGCSAESPVTDVHLQHIENDSLEITVNRADILGIVKDDIAQLFMGEQVPEQTQTQPQKLLSDTDVVKDSQKENYEKKIVVLNASTLSPEYRTQQNQLWIATHGPGCATNSRTGTVHLTHTVDGDKMVVHRSEILGVAKDEVVQALLGEQRQEPTQAQTPEIGGY